MLTYPTTDSPTMTLLRLRLNHPISTCTTSARPLLIKTLRNNSTYFVYRIKQTL